jgi:hypothetical protein
MRNDDIQDLIAQLERLQVQQTELLVRLRSATDREASLTGDFDQEAQEPKGFTVGDKFTIKNPKVFQANQGTITKSGQNESRSHPHQDRKSYGHQRIS